MHPDTVCGHRASLQIMVCPFALGWISFSEDLIATSQTPCSFGVYHAMASPPPPSHQTRGDSSEDYYYLIVAVAAVTVLLLVSNMIAVGCCSPCSILEAIRRFLRSRGLLAGGENNDGRISELIPVCKYQKEQAQEHECAVCLSVIADGEDFRQLPRCKHSFHASCIDMWLYSHHNCPLCRADVLERPPSRFQTAAAGREISIQRHPTEPRGMGSLIVALM